MADMLQQFAVTGLIAASALYVGRRSWLSLRGRSSGCGMGCGTCPSNKQNETVVVELTDFRSSHRAIAAK